MPDKWTIYNYTLAILFGVVIGWMFSLLTSHKNKKRKSKPNEEFKEDFEHIFNKISELQEELKIVQSVNASYDGSDPIQFNLRSINKKLNNTLISYRKKISRNGKKILEKTESDEVSPTSKIEQTEDLSQVNNNKTSEPREPSVKEIPSNSFEEKEFESQNLPSQIITLYNRGISERSDRNLFWETFPIIRIGNANAVAQGLGEVFAPDFRETGNGDFLAIKCDNQSYFVVPLFDTTITPSAFNEGGISYAFDCPGYDSQSARSILKVNKAATFRRGGGQWFLVDGGKGELVLQN